MNTRAPITPLPHRLALAVCFVSLSLSGCAETFLLHPSTDPLRAPGAQRETVSFDGGEVEAWVRHHDGTGSRLFVMELVGNAGRAEHNSFIPTSAFQSRFVEHWRINYPGFGASTGPADLERMGPAMLAVHDAIAERAQDKKVLVLGHSIGAALALFVASKRETAGVVTLNAGSIPSLIIKRHGWWNLWLLATPVWLQVPTSLDAVASAAAVTEKGLYVTSGDDSTIPLDYQRDVCRAHSGQSKEVHRPNAGHNTTIGEAEQVTFNKAMAWLLQEPTPAK